METLPRILLVFHFLGLAMGFATSFGNMVMGRLIDRAAPAERPVLGRFPPAMARVGTAGIVLLWITGLGMILTKWGGFGNIPNMPWPFHAKLTLVVALTFVVTYLHELERRMRGGDAAAMARIQLFGKIAFLLAVAIVVFAVLTFD